MIKKLYVSLLLIFTVAQNYAQDKKVAVVSFYTYKIIDFKELGLGSEGLITEVANLRGNPDFDLTPILEKFHEKIFSEYVENFPFN